MQITLFLVSRTMDLYCSEQEKNTASKYTSIKLLFGLLPGLRAGVFARCAGKNTRISER
jgi:hypothetical protein